MNFKKFDLLFFIATFLILSLSILAIFSTDAQAAKEQLLFSLVGLILYFALSFFDYKVLKEISGIIYILGILSLIAVLLFGTETRGSIRWFNVGSFGIQPSEFMKVALILTLATLFSPLKSKFLSLKRIFVTGLLTLVSSIPVFLQPDLGTTISYLFIWGFVLLFSGVRPYYILIAVLVIGILSAPLWNLLKPYQQDRIVVFLNPKADPLGGGYNVIQSIVAVGSGQFLGKGFGSGTQSHLQYLPAYNTDFIFAAFAEEWGLIGVTIFLGLYLLLFLRILKIARKASDDFGTLLSMGVFAMVLFQFVISVGMNIGIMPVTGIPLPLFSYGGSSMLSTLIALGLIQSVAVHKKLV